jgi:hypothetical protein
MVDYPTLKYSLVTEDSNREILALEKRDFDDDRSLKKNEAPLLYSTSAIA